MEIIIRDKSKDERWGKKKDSLHQERKKLVDKMKPGMFSKDQMEMRDCKDESDENKRVEDYDKWKEMNESNMKRWHEINRKFKKHGEEGRVHSLDDIRNNKVLYD